MQDDLTGKRVLVVEDSPVIAVDCERMLEEFGCIVVGPTGSMATALELAEEEELDAAIVDLNIRGGKAYPLLAILKRRGVPFLLASGYANWSMPDEWAERPRLPKPYKADGLKDALLHTLADGQNGRSA